MLLPSIDKAVLALSILFAFGANRELKTAQAIVMPKVINLSCAATKTGVMPKLDMTLDGGDLGAIRIQYRIDFLDENKDLFDSNMRLLAINGITNYSTYLKSLKETNDYYYIQIEFIYLGEIFGNYEMKISSIKNDDYILSQDENKVDEAAQTNVLEDETVTTIYQHFDFNNITNGKDYLLPIVDLNDLTFSMSLDAKTISLHETKYASATLLFSNGFAGSDFQYNDNFYSVPVTLNSKDEVVSISLAQQGYFDVKNKVMVSNENYYSFPTDKLICSMHDFTNEIKAKLVITEFGVNMSNFEIQFDVNIKYALIGCKDAYFIINEVPLTSVNYESGRLK